MSFCFCVLVCFFFVDVWSCCIRNYLFCCCCCVLKRFRIDARRVSIFRRRAFELCFFLWVYLVWCCVVIDFVVFWSYFFVFCLFVWIEIFCMCILREIRMLTIRAKSIFLRMCVCFCICCCCFCMFFVWWWMLWILCDWLWWLCVVLVCVWCLWSNVKGWILIYCLWVCLLLLCCILCVLVFVCVLWWLLWVLWVLVWGVWLFCVCLCVLRSVDGLFESVLYLFVCMIGVVVCVIVMFVVWFVCVIGCFLLCVMCVVWRCWVDVVVCDVLLCLLFKFCRIWIGVLEWLMSVEEVMVVDLFWEFFEKMWEVVFEMMWSVWSDWVVCVMFMNVYDARRDETANRRRDGESTMGLTNLWLMFE